VGPITKLAAPPGPRTAAEALALVLPHARELDAAAVWLWISSGTNLRHDGRSLDWEFRFRLPRDGAIAHLSLRPDEAGGDDLDRAPLLLHRRVTPEPTTNAARAPLPQPFRDSPAVTAELAARGIDLIAGATEIRIEGRTDAATGVAAWHAFAGRDELQLPFAP
jgi:hypothetical protein